MCFHDRQKWHDHSWQSCYSNTICKCDRRNRLFHSFRPSHFNYCIAMVVCLIVALIFPFLRMLVAVAMMISFGFCPYMFQACPRFLGWIVSSWRFFRGPPFPFWRPMFPRLNQWSSFTFLLWAPQLNVVSVWRFIDFWLHTLDLVLVWLYSSYELQLLPKFHLVPSVEMATNHQSLITPITLSRVASK